MVCSDKKKKEAEGDVHREVSGMGTECGLGSDHGISGKTFKQGVTIVFVSEKVHSS